MENGAEEKKDTRIEYDQNDEKTNGNEGTKESVH